MRKLEIQSSSSSLASCGHPLLHCCVSDFHCTQASAELLSAPSSVLEGPISCPLGELGIGWGLYHALVVGRYCTHTPGVVPSEESAFTSFGTALLLPLHCPCPAWAHLAAALLKLQGLSSGLFAEGCDGCDSQASHCRGKQIMSDSFVEGQKCYRPLS